MNGGLRPGEFYSDIKHFHLFCGAGGGALGFQRGHARVGRAHARFRCLGGVDSDPAGIADFSRLVGTRGTVLDLFDRDQYEAWHGKPPPPIWRAATALDILAAAGGEHPDIVFTSPPCKGFSGLQSPTRAASAKYQALNALTVRSIALTLEAFKDDPPSFIIFENVPRIAQRGRDLLDDIVLVLRAAGYAVAETVHDCGRVGGLGQTRKRFLLVARHVRKVPPFLYEPPNQPLRTVGDVIGELPLPDEPGLAMHRLPRLEWQTWVRLALIPPGKDWRALQDLRVVNGRLQDIGIEPLDAHWHAGALGVRPWGEPAGTVTGGGRPAQGAFAVEDPRFDRAKHNNCFRVVRLDEPSPSVTGGTGPTAGGLAVADPRCTTSHQGKGKYRVTQLDEQAGAVIAESGTGNGAYAVADPRLGSYGEHSGKLRVEACDASAHTVTGSDRVGSGALSLADPRPPRDLGQYQPYGLKDWHESAATVTGQAAPGAGPYSVADPRPAAWVDGREHFATGGHYGVVPLTSPSCTVVGGAKHDAGPWSVAGVLPAPGDRPDRAPLIVAVDGTWHRPFTTLELAALQGFPWQALAYGGGLSGNADARHRERVGNAVPPPAAAAVASVMGKAILQARAGVTFQLSAEPVWVRGLAAALSIADGRIHA